MIPVETPETDFSYHLPGRPGEGEMPCLRRNGQTWTFWRVEHDDDLEGAGSVEALYHWPDPIPVAFGFATAETPLDDIELHSQLPEPVDEGVQASGTLDEEQRLFLRDGGLLVVRVAAVPPPAVSVWLAGLVAAQPEVAPGRHVGDPEGDGGLPQ